MSSQTWKFKRSRFKSGESKCYYCDTVLDSDICEIDHKHPKSRGGTSQVKNLVLSCRSCNRAKSTRTEKEFYEYVVRMAEIFKGRLNNGEEIF